MTDKARVLMEISGDERKLLLAYQKAMRENQKFKDELKDLARTGRQSSDWATKFGDDIKRGFSPQAVLALAGAITGVGGVVAGLQKVVQVAGEAREEIKAIADELVQSYDAARNLWQISQGKTGYAELRRDQRMAMAKEGLGREEAGQLLFNLESLKQGQHLDTIAKAGRFMDPFTASQYFTTIASPLNFGQDGNSPEQILSGLIAGAGESKFNTAETADWILRIAPIMADFKTTQAELLAVGASISEAAANPELLATYFRSGHASLNRWQQEAIANAQGEGTPAPTAPEAPEKPVYEEPEFKLRMGMSDTALINAKMAHEERVEAEKKRHAERMADYDKDMEEYRQKQAKYEKELVDWTKSEADRKRIGVAAAGAVGLVQTFQAMRESDPEAYQQARQAEIRFNNFAAALEKGLPKAQVLTPQIQAEIDKGQLYQQKVDERPRQLDEQHQQRVAKAMVSVALEDKAEAENRLKTAIDQAKALTALTGGSMAGMKGWEKLLETGATIGGAERATRAAQMEMIRTLRVAAPDQYQKYLEGTGLRVEKQIVGGFGQNVMTRDELVADKITERMLQGIDQSIAELSTERINRDYEADISAAGPITSVTPTVDLSETNDELSGVNGKLDELIEVTKAGQRGAQGELPTTPEPGGHGY